MGQKVNPISLRLEKTNRHFDSCWYDDYNYTDLVLQDLKIKSYFKTVLNQIQYPEARLLIENLPKRTNVNLFYYNPTRSRQKKNVRFQLQNFKETKKNRYTSQNIIRCQQVAQTKRKEEWKNCLTRFDLRLLEGRLANPANIQKNPPLRARPQLKEHKTTTSSIPHLGPKTGGEPLATFLFDKNKNPQQIIETTFSKKTDEVQTDALSRSKDSLIRASLDVNLAGPLHPFLSPLDYKSGNSYNVNRLVLDFVLYTGKPSFLRNPSPINPYDNPSILQRWVRERFFVRYLLSFFYCKFLQNKRYTLNNTLYGINTLYNPALPKTGSLFANPQKRMPSGLYTGNRGYKSRLESLLSERYKTFFSIGFFRSLIAKQGATLLVQEIIYYLERKVPFRRIKTSLLREIPQYKRIKGIRISCSGRVGGRSKKAQRSKTQSVKIGVTSLGVFSSKIDFACKSAHTRFGLIGVKVWVCYQ